MILPVIYICDCPNEHGGGWQIITEILGFKRILRGIPTRAQAESVKMEMMSRALAIYRSMELDSTSV